MDKFTLFVDYADFYVNIIMLTKATILQLRFIIFNCFQDVALTDSTKALDVVFARQLAKIM